jgi:hypothetical protein
LVDCLADDTLNVTLVFGATLYDPDPEVVVVVEEPP